MRQSPDRGASELISVPSTVTQRTIAVAAPANNCPRPPDPHGKRLCHALADAYAEGASAAGHEITRIEVAQLDFPILRTQEEFERGDLPEMLVGARDGIVSAQHLVAIFQLWHGTMPALLNAFLEQVMRPGVALEYRTHGFPRKLLTGR